MKTQKKRIKQLLLYFKKHRYIIIILVITFGAACKKDFNLANYDGPEELLANAKQFYNIKNDEFVTKVAKVKNVDKKKIPVMKPRWDKAQYKTLANGKKAIVVPGEEFKTGNREIAFSRKVVFKETDGKIDEGEIVEFYGSKEYIEQNDEELTNDKVGEFTGTIINYNINYEYVSSSVYKAGVKQANLNAKVGGTPKNFAQNKSKVSTTGRIASTTTKDEPNGTCTNWWLYQWSWDSNGAITGSSLTFLGYTCTGYAPGGSASNPSGGHGSGSQNFDIYTDNSPCPKNPLHNMEIAPSNQHGNINGGRFLGARRQIENGVMVTKNHGGLDLRADVNTNVYSMYLGTVVGLVKNTFSPGEYKKGSFGNYVVIESYINGDMVRILYGHMNDIYPEMNEVIPQGQLIGKTGITGNAAKGAFPHLHIQMSANGGALNPEYYLATTFGTNGSVTYNPTCN